MSQIKSFFSVNVKFAISYKRISTVFKGQIMNHGIYLLLSGVIVNQHLNVKKGIWFSYTVA